MGQSLPEEQAPGAAWAAHGRARAGKARLLSREPTPGAPLMTGVTSLKPPGGASALALDGSVWKIPFIPLLFISCKTP